MIQIVSFIIYTWVYIYFYYKYIVRVYGVFLFLNIYLILKRSSVILHLPTIAKTACILCNIQAAIFLWYNLPVPSLYIINSSCDTHVTLTGSLRNITVPAKMYAQSLPYNSSLFVVQTLMNFVILLDPYNNRNLVSAYAWVRICSGHYDICNDVLRHIFLNHDLSQLSCSKPKDSSTRKNTIDTVF